MGKSKYLEEIYGIGSDVPWTVKEIDWTTSSSDGWGTRQPFGSIPAYNIDGISDGVTSKDNCFRHTFDDNLGRGWNYLGGAYYTGSRSLARMTGWVYMPSANTGSTGFILSLDDRAGIATLPQNLIDDSNQNTLGTWTWFDTGEVKIETFNAIGVVGVDTTMRFNGTQIVPIINGGNDLLYCSGVTISWN